MNPPRILALQLKRIGDLILTAPATAALRQAFPDAEIELVVDGAGADLAACLPGVTRILPYRRARPNAATWAAVTCGEWNLCLDFTGTDRSALLARLSGATTRLGYAKFSTGARRLAYTRLCSASVRDCHTADFHLALVADACGRHAIPMAGINTALSLPASAHARVDAILQEDGPASPLAVIHPGTARREKFWPAARWVEVVEQLCQRGMRVVMTGTGRGLESDDVAFIRGHVRCPLLDVTGQLSLTETAALITRARLAAGVDSMAMHLAALQRVPQVVLFGPTNPFHWRPLHAQALVLVPGREEPLTRFDPRARGGHMDRISTSAVAAALDRLLQSGSDSFSSPAT